jgi:membrane-associated phospholipid phosphatase
MLEAAALSSAAGYALKQLVDRERPYQTADADAWGENGDAFPSVHTTAAFAIGTVLAESGNDRHRWLRRALGYGLAAGTAYARMDHDAHWLSDTVAGAGLGIATARFVMKQRERDARGQFAIAPAPGGMAFSYTVTLRE